MIFGKIEYLNLLPFHIFMKRFVKGSAAKMAMEYKKSVPSTINRAFISRAVDAAFISSIKAKGYAHVNLGIIAKKSVQSVLAIPSKEAKKDTASATSNILINILGLQGEVLIGDRALKYALEHDDYVDLAQAWHEKYQLPFVFALLCYHKEKKLYKKIERKFVRQNVKIPYYILQKASLRTEIQAKDILHYLQLISYDLNYKAKLGLSKFYNESKRGISSL